MATRTVFYQISPLGQWTFYGLALVSLILCAYGICGRVRLWRKGEPYRAVGSWNVRIGELASQAFAHQRIRRRTFAGTIHALLFYGMLALFIGTNIVALEHYGALVFGPHWLYRGAFYLACKMTLDVFGLGLLIAVGLAIARRYIVRPASIGHDWHDTAFLVLLLAATLTGFLLEGAGLASDPQRGPFGGFSPVGSLFAHGFTGLNATVGTYPFIWWAHSILVLSVIAALPYGRRLHLFVAPMTIISQPDRAIGVLEPLDMTAMEATGKVGVGSLLDLNRWELMSLDGCMECGRCTDACPAHVSGKVLDPKQLILDLRGLLNEAGSVSSGPVGSVGAASSGRNADNSRLSTDVISDEALWACTNCHACVRECPALIRHVDIIDGIRRYRVAEGKVSGSLATMLRQLTSRENPWGLPGSQRLDWARGLEIPAADKNDGREVLLWVGCAGAFEPRAQSTTRALAALLTAAGVKFSVLGPRERCTGDPARRSGDELQFQQLAESNVVTLDTVGATTIVTQCPHCMHTIGNEYPQFGGHYSVIHHTQYLESLVSSGRLKLSGAYSETVTYHDPCYLARVNGETRAPRRLAAASVTGPLLEPERRESKTFCCGAGGGRMWMEEPPEHRPGVGRAKELMNTGARTIAAACPFCKVMLGDSVAQIGVDNPPPVMDVAEIMLAALVPGTSKT